MRRSQNIYTTKGLTEKKSPFNPMDSHFYVGHHDFNVHAVKSGEVDPDTLPAVAVEEPSHARIKRRRRFRPPIKFSLEYTIACY